MLKGIASVFCVLCTVGAAHFLDAPFINWRQFVSNAFLFTILIIFAALMLLAMTQQSEK